MCIGLLTPLPLNQQTGQAPLLRQSPPLYWFLIHLPPQKSRIFSEPPKHLHFSSLIPSYLLEVTKFLGKVSQFKFLVMTSEKYFCQ